MEEHLRKSSHKVLLVILKFIPMITALCYALNIIFALFGVDTAILSHISGMSLLTWIFILVATYVFKFCIYHRMFLYYILINDILNIIDYYIGIPVASSVLLMIHLVIMCTFLFLILYLYVRSHKNTATKDP